jgi:ribosomal protein S17
MTNRKLKKIERRLKDLQKHYPSNEYKINDKYQIIRVSGRKPHKTSKKEN